MYNIRIYIHYVRVYINHACIHASAYLGANMDVVAINVCVYVSMQACMCVFVCMYV